MRAMNGAAEELAKLVNAGTASPREPLRWRISNAGS